MRLIDADALLENVYTFMDGEEVINIITNAPTVQRDGWVSVEDRLPELKDDSVLAHFENGSIETVHIEDYFKPITNGFDEDGNQIYTKWYLHSNPLVTHWKPLPEPPKE